jgi:1,4-alpha-glucan branching enzyme
VLNATYREHAPLWSRDHDGAAFRRLFGPQHNPNVVAFARTDWHGNTVAVLCNFSGVPVHDFELEMPEAGVWTEILNSDAVEYGGSGVGNFGIVSAAPAGDGVARASITLPPLGVIWLHHSR